MISRRGLLKVGTGIFGGLVVIGAISSETDLIDDPDDDDTAPETSSDSESDTESGTPQEEGSENEKTTSETDLTRETLHDERIYTHKRWPHEFESGTMLYVEFDVIEGGPGSFVFNETEYEGDSDNLMYRIDTEKTMSHEIQTSGLTYLEAVPRGEAEVVVEVER